jgi:hypothetical protein
MTIECRELDRLGDQIDAQREAEPPLLKLMRKYRNEVLSLQQQAGRASIDRRGRGEALRDIENALRWLAGWMEHDLEQAARESALADVYRKTDPRERSAYITSIGAVCRVKGAYCSCGHQLEPRDFEATAGGSAFRVICPGCHCDVFQVEVGQP